MLDYLFQNRKNRRLFSVKNSRDSTELIGSVLDDVVGVGVVLVHLVFVFN
jgi:hypothetical protein